MKTNRILLADDHEITRTGLKVFITSLLPHSVIDEAWDGVSAVQRVNQNKYNLIILDINMPATDSYLLVSTIISIQPAANILMFSMNEEIYAKRYLQLGAKGYVSKTAPPAELGKAISTVLNNKRYISSALSESLAEEALGKKATNNPFDKLSAREFEVVQYIIKGESSAVISQALHLKSSTIGTFKARIFEKLNCKNIFEVTKLAKIYNIQ